MVGVSFLRPFGSPGTTTTDRAERIGNAPGHERGAARGATGLAIPAGEHHAFLGDAINVRCWVPERRPTEVGTEIGPSGIVGHQYDDVGLLLRRCL